MEQIPVPENKPVMYNNRNKILVLVVIIAIFSYSLGFNFGKKGYVYEPKEFKIVNQKDSPKEVDYKLLWDAINVVNEKYIEKPVNAQKTLYGAVHGAVAATGDPYTDFFEPKDLESFKSDLKGSFDGIGAEVSKKDGMIVIVSPLDDSPAKKAGLLPKDIILKINEKSVADWSVEQAVSEIRGKKGTPVTLTLYREGQSKPFEVTIIRDVIVIKSVKWELKEIVKDGKTKKIGIISISRFGEDTNTLFTKAVSELTQKFAEGYVIDLRNNPGGYLQSAVDLASNWVKMGDVVVTEAKSQGEPEVFKASGVSKLSGLPTVVLINGGSASASEILAGALKDHGLAKLIGEKSFGKGSVQELVDLPEGGAIKVTVAKWITPSGKNLNKDGLEPDVPVKLTEEDIKNTKDPQMEKALEEIAK